MDIKAQLNYLRIAPRKVRLMAGLLKGMSVGRAEVGLRHSVKRSAAPLLKLLKSAVANAQNNFELPERGLYVKEITVNEGPPLKRSRPRAFGRAAPIRKKTSHVSLVLKTKDDTDRRSRRKKSAPEVRDITAEDTKEDFLEKPKETKEQEVRLKSRKPADFVRRVFRRKVI